VHPPHVLQVHRAVAVAVKRVCNNFRQVVVAVVQSHVQWPGWEEKEERQQHAVWKINGTCWNLTLGSRLQAKDKLGIRGKRMKGLHLNRKKRSLTCCRPRWSHSRSALVAIWTWELWLAQRQLPAAPGGRALLSATAHASGTIWFLPCVYHPVRWTKRVIESQNWGFSFWLNTLLMHTQMWRRRWCRIPKSEIFLTFLKRSASGSSSSSSTTATSSGCGAIAGVDFAPTPKVKLCSSTCAQITRSS